MAGRRRRGRYVLLPFLSAALAKKPQCEHAVPTSPTDAAYLDAARSEAASLEPWQWPVVARGRANATDAVDASHFSAVLDGASGLFAPAYGHWCSPLRTAAELAILADALDALAGESGAVALAFVQNMHPSSVFGHVWDFVNAAYCAVLRPRRQTTRRNLTVYLPAGFANCSEEHALLAGLFGGERAERFFRLRFERAPWVPEANRHRQWAYAFGGVPAALRGRVGLLSNFRNSARTLGPSSLPPTVTDAFRDDAWAAAGVARGGGGARATVLYVRSASWPTHRAVVDEDALVAALAAHVAAAHPRLSFAALHVHDLEPAAEVAVFARAALVVSLWGAALHNCRFMAPGATVVELFGGLGNHYGDTTLYHEVCSQAGLRHAPLIIASSFPADSLAEPSPSPSPHAHMRARAARPARDERPWAEQLAAADLNAAERHRARVNTSEVVAFLRRVFPPEPCAPVDWTAVHGDFNSFLGAHVNPLTGRPLRLVHIGRWAQGAGQYPQYAEPSPRCREAVAVTAATRPPLRDLGS